MKSFAPHSHSLPQPAALRERALRQCLSIRQKTPSTSMWPMPPPKSPAHTSHHSCTPVRRHRGYGCRQRLGKYSLVKGDRRRRPSAAHACRVSLSGAWEIARHLVFTPPKSGALGDAGMFVTAHDDRSTRPLLRNHGAKPKYHHEAVGGNFRLDEMQAAFAREAHAVKRLD